MNIQEFSSMRKKELHTTYNVEVDGVVKLVELTDSKREEKKEGSTNCKTLYLANVDGVSYEDYLNITDLCNKIAGKNIGSRKNNGTRKPKQPTKPLTDDELTDVINKHVDGLQNAYANFYNLLVSWGIDINAINFVAFDSSEYREKISDICTAKNEDLKEDFEIAQQIAALQEKQRRRREQRENDK